MSTDIQPSLHCDGSSSAMSGAQGFCPLSIIDAVWSDPQPLHCRLQRVPLATERLLQGMQGSKVVLKAIPTAKALIWRSEPKTSPDLNRTDFGIIVPTLHPLE